MTDQGLVSVILPTRNRADLLQLALQSLRAQTLPTNQFEVLVINNGSTDHTNQVIESLQQQSGNIRYFFDPTPGLHVGRHRGLQAARGDILVFADDDIEALPGWLVTLQEAFSEPDIAMIGGNNLPMFVEIPPDWLMALWNRSTMPGGRALGALSILELSGPPRPISPYYVWGCNFAIRKDVLLQAGGFHPDGMPRELIRFRGDGETHVSRFVAESGLKCLFHPGASVYHKVTPERMAYAYFRQRGFNQGVSDSYTALRAETARSAPQRFWPYRVARWGWHQLRATVSRLQTPATATRALAEFTFGHQEGYAFHQHAYRTDPEVREWVHRERYF